MSVLIQALDRLETLDREEASRQDKSKVADSVPGEESDALAEVRRGDAPPTGLAERAMWRASQAGEDAYDDDEDGYRRMDGSGAAGRTTQFGVTIFLSFFSALVGLGFLYYSNDTDKLRDTHVVPEPIAPSREAFLARQGVIPPIESSEEIVASPKPVIVIKPTVEELRVEASRKALQSEPSTAEREEQRMAAVLAPPPSQFPVAAPVPASIEPKPAAAQPLTAPLAVPSAPPAPEMPVEVAPPAAPGPNPNWTRADAQRAERLEAPKEIEIIQHNRPDPLQEVSDDAFKAFRAGESAKAERGFRTILEEQPGRREALLGLASLAVQDARFQEARELYEQVLYREPGNTLAQAGLVSLWAHSDPVRAESRLKSLIDGDPHSPHLQFVLGGVYAAQARWSMAKDAFFQAFRLDRSDSNVAFNLAVSLDHMGQPKQALQFYREARDLSGSRPMGFEHEEVERRIEKLSQAVDD